MSSLSSIVSPFASGQQAFVNQVPGLKADSLVLFGYYFKWPKNAVAGNDFVIGLLGDPPFNAGRVTERFGKVGSKDIRVLTFDSAKDYQPCHILFVADAATERSVERTSQDRLAAALKETNGATVLVVAETNGFAGRGAMINFAVDLAVNRLTTEVNVAAVKQAKLGFTKYFVNFSQTNKCILVEDNPAGAQGAAQ